MSTNDPLMIGV